MQVLLSGDIVSPVSSCWFCMAFSSGINGYN